DSLWKRLLNAARLKKAILAREMPMPLHIFGSLDPVACPLFFLAGADIFDGLTWLRYGYFNGTAIYRQNILATGNMPAGTRDGELSAHIHVQNYHELGRIRDSMIRFVQVQEFRVFGTHERYFEE